MAPKKLMKSRKPASKPARLVRRLDRRPTMASSTVQRIVPSLWYVKEAEEAARFYASIFPNSSVDTVTSLPAESPSGPAGSVAIVEFTLAGQQFFAMSAGPLDP